MAIYRSLDTIKSRKKAGQCLCKISLFITNDHMLFEQLIKMKDLKCGSQNQSIVLTARRLKINN